MKHPSIRFRLMLGTCVVVTVLLAVSNLATYRSFQTTLNTETDKQLMQSVSLLAKSAELEADSLDYEWEEAMKSSHAPGVSGLFQFWDVNSGRITRSPDLLSGDLPQFHGELNKPVLRDITLPNGLPARAVGLLHYPFTDELAISEAAKVGKVLKPEEYPQVLVCAQETASNHARLDLLAKHLTRSAVATLLAICVSILVIVTWCLRPIREFAANLKGRPEQDKPPRMEIPDKMPHEIAGLAETFNEALEKVEMARAREKEFALHAAHELRTPVAGILATLEQALHRPRDAEELKRRIGIAQEITSGMRVTLDSLMRLARLRGHLEVAAKMKFDPIASIREVIGACGATISRRGLEIAGSLPEKAGALDNDAGLFRVLVSNLIENAVEYSPRGSQVEITAALTPDRLTFSTANECGAMSDEEIQRLFQPFQRGATAAAETGDGHAGLGLSLAREAAHLLGGRMYAERRENRIVFAAELPR